MADRSTNGSTFGALQELSADEPHASHCEDLMTFGRFVGTWDMDVRFFDPTGQTTWHTPAAWSFGWVLDGRAIQDVLVYPSRTGTEERGERGIGTTLRYYDPHQQLWRLVFVGAVSNTFVVLTGRPVDDRIVIEGPDVDGSPLYWEFSDITDDAFHWRGWIADGEAKSWRLEQEMFAHRRPCAINTGERTDDTR